MEPCAGAGDISKILREYEYNNIIEYDLVPRREGIKQLDFLESKINDKVDTIITNPPFKFRKTRLLDFGQVVPGRNHNGLKDWMPEIHF